MSVTLAPAVPQDAEALGSIMDDWINEMPWMPKLHSRADTIGFLRHLIATQVVTVARDGVVVLGFLARKGAEVTALYLDRAARRRGSGRTLLNEAKQQGHLTLWTFAANDDAVAFYRREGFVEIERTDGSGNDERLPDIRLAWRG